VPLEGAPLAFGAAYEKISLPLFREVFSLARFKNHATYNKHLLECLQTFPSLYQLFPAQHILYAHHSYSDVRNPLRDSQIPDRYRSSALKCHEVLSRADEILVRAHTPVFTIYTEFHASVETEVGYRVEPLGVERGYNVREVYSRTRFGDGTVPMESAAGGPNCLKKPVTNVDHAFMCNSEIVATNLLGVL